MSARFRGRPVLLGLLLTAALVVLGALGTSARRGTGASPTAASLGPPKGDHKGLPLSEAALFSGFARRNDVPGAEHARQLEEDEAKYEKNQAEVGVAVRQANADYNLRPQDETSIAIRPGTSGASGTWVIGANDYGIGVPIGGGAYTSSGVTYFPPFPLLVTTDGVVEPPVGTGDPAVAYGRARPGTPGIKPGTPVVYYGSLAFSAQNCENGVQVARSLDDGHDWNRTFVPTVVPGGVGFVAYQGLASDCTVFHDKEYIAVDNSGGPHDGRVYVTWTKFLFDRLGNYLRSPIMMAWSDDNGTTFSTPVQVSGDSMTWCPNESAPGNAGHCVENQFSVPVVLANGNVAVAFENDQGAGFNQGYRDQYLMTVVGPNGVVVGGPYHVADLYDGINDYPINQDGRQTLCNSNFRVNSAGNLAVDAAGNLYVTYSDDRSQAGQFPYPTYVGNRASGYACPAGKSTNTDVYLLASTDGGKSWKEITPEAAQAKNDQWFPWVAAGAKGRVDVVFYDRSKDSKNKLAWTTLAQSADGGKHWTATAASGFASNFDDAFFGTGRFIGDYNGLAIDSGGYSHPVWTGVTPGKQDSDIFTSTVPAPGGD